jgi:ribonucleoside-diphosphate reductase alpha chain/ribonucleoside-triphosphate reductase
MQIKKRNGQIVEFDKQRIVNAVLGAMGDVNAVDNEIAERVADTILLKLETESKDIIHVEEIQDLVEIELMRGIPQVGKAYVLYREERNRNRNNQPEKYKLLSNNFLSKYKKTKPPMTDFGTFVYYRTYSRWLPNENRREFWWETVARSVDFNCNLAKTTRAEAEKIYDNVFNLKQFLSGRSFWSSGTLASYNNPISQFNCAGVCFDSFDVPKDVCYLLMLGCGVGINVEKKYVEQLPSVRNNVRVIHQNYNAIAKKARKETTEFNISGDVMEIVVGDSKTGWSSAVDYLIKVFYQIEFKHVNNIIVNYNNVRPYGEAIKTFGGKASGHVALQIMLEKITNILLKDNTGRKKLKPIDAMDIITILAEGIVVGGVRRSAIMVFSDDKDVEMMNAKMNLYTQDEQGNWVANKEILHRMMSNNSTAYWSRPTYEELKARFEIIRYSGENNFYVMENAIKRKPNAKISNPLT